MNKTIEQRIADIEEQLAQLKQEAKASADEWPKMGDEFYRVDAYGYCDDVWQGGTADMAMLNCGNVFRNVAEAEHEIDRRKVLTELRKLAKASWNKEPVSCAYFSLRFTREGGPKVCIYSYPRRELGVVYFATEKAAEAAIETIGGWVSMWERIGRHFGIPVQLDGLRLLHSMLRDGTPLLPEHVALCRAEVEQQRQIFRTHDRKQLMSLANTESIALYMQEQAA